MKQAFSEATQTHVSGWLFCFAMEILLRKILVIDNYDSFTYNLVQMFLTHDLCVEVCRNDSIVVSDVEKMDPDCIVISPGPKDPANAGISIPVIKAFCDKKPILGVCLGMQCINEAFGGATVRSPVPVHGKKSLIEHEGRGIFQNISSPFIAARYHSLSVEIKNGNLKTTAKTKDGIIMGISHVSFPLHGVQFHPESFMTEDGKTIIENFLKSKIV
jgi:anthranilate synthase component 2